MKFILWYSRCDHFVPEVTAEIAWRAQIDLPPQHRRKLSFHANEPEHTRTPTWLELDQKVDDAVFLKPGSQDRAERDSF
jgi:hypothetical protein